MIGRQAHYAATRVLSLLMVAIGVALIVQAVGQRGGAISPRLLLGVLFVVAGAGRLYLQVRRRREAGGGGT
jgi:uncharacterized membrane protein HdeD (DUF308 family)